jgi:hypothetical protein
MSVSYERKIDGLNQLMVVDFGDVKRVYFIDKGAFKMSDRFAATRIYQILKCTLDRIESYKAGEAFKAGIRNRVKEVCQFIEAIDQSAINGVLERLTAAAGVTEFVPVAKYRQITDHFNKLCSDYCACVGKGEKGYWLEVAKRILELDSKLGCKRAKPDDLMERAKAEIRLKQQMEEAEYFLNGCK